MGTLRRQLGEIGQIALMPRVLLEVARVREELGYPIMVTPYSQFIGTQAVLNVMATQAGEQRWSRMPDEILRYVLGHFGHPPGPIDDEVRQRAADAPRTRELDRPLPEPRLDELRSSARQQSGTDLPDREILLRTVLPTDQITAMRAAGPAPRWNPGGADPGRIGSAVEFVERVCALPNWRRIEVALGGERVSLRRDDAHGKGRS